MLVWTGMYTLVILVLLIGLSVLNTEYSTRGRLVFLLVVVPVLYFTVAALRFIAAS